MKKNQPCQGTQGSATLTLCVFWQPSPSGPEFPSLLQAWIRDSYFLLSPNILKSIPWRLGSYNSDEESREKFKGGTQRDLKSCRVWDARFEDFYIASLMLFTNCALSSSHLGPILCNPYSFGQGDFGFCVLCKNNFNNKIYTFTLSRNSCSSWWVFVTVVTERSDQFTWFKKKHTYYIWLFLGQDLARKKSLESNKRSYLNFIKIINQKYKVHLALS